MRHQDGHVIGEGRHQGERGHRAAAAREHLDRSRAERLDDGVHVAGLDPGIMVDPAVLAGAAAEAARVVGDHGAVREMRRQRAEAAGVHWLADHEQRWASIGGRQRTMDVVDEVGFGSLEHLRSHNRADSSRVENSSDAKRFGAGVGLGVGRALELRGDVR